MRETTKKNMRIMWAIVIAFGLLSGAILFRYLLEKKIYYVIPICLILIFAAYYLQLYVKHKSYSIIYDRKGFDTLLIYLCPFIVLYDPEKKKKYDRGYSRMFSLSGLTVPRFTPPKSDEEFEDLKKNLEFNIWENITGSLILLVIALALVYYSYIYCFFETALFCIDVFLMFLILFTSAQVLFTLIEDTGVFDIEKLEMEEGQEQPSESEIAHNDYLIASRMLLYSYYDKNINHTDSDLDYLINRLSGHIAGIHDAEHIKFEDMFNVDLIVTLYNEGIIDSVPEAVNGYIDLLSDSFETVAVEHKSRFKDDIKDYILVCEHIVRMMAKKGRTEEGTALLEKIRQITVDPKKDSEVIYLNRKNQLLLQGTEDEPEDLEFERNSLDIISEMTADYAIPNEKPSLPKLKLKKKNTEEAETKEDGEETAAAAETGEEKTDAAESEEIAAEEVLESEEETEEVQETAEEAKQEEAEESEEAEEPADVQAAEEELPEEDSDEASEAEESMEEVSEEAEDKQEEESFVFDEDFSDAEEYSEGGEIPMTPSSLDDMYKTLTPEELENAEKNKPVEEKKEGKFRSFIKKIRKEDEMLDAKNEDIVNYVEDERDEQ